MVGVIVDNLTMSTICGKYFLMVFKQCPKFMKSVGLFRGYLLRVGSFYLVKICHETHSYISL